MEVKKRIGYLPETPPLYPEMEVIEYLTFVGQLKGIPSADIKRRADEVIGRCALGDVRAKLIGKLSKGYRQRVGIAQAIIHNPDVLILDEPTSGLDPKQIIEIRELLKALAGDHTIILSTHILSEVEHSCERVIIISQGKLVAIDSVANLTNRLRGSEAVSARSGSRRRPPQPHRSAAAPGTGGRRQPRGDEGFQGRPPDLRSGKPARPPHPRRTGAQRGQLRLESQRTPRRGPEPGRHLPATHHQRKERRRRPEVRNILLICKKELKSYFASPIAYLLMAFFGLIFGFGFFTATRDFVRFSFQAQMMGQQQPTNVNEQIIRPLLGFASTIALFLIPMISMRLFAEEKRTGTIELLLTSPIKDIEIILGKWLGAVLLYLCVLGMSMLNVAMLFAWGKPDLKPVLVAYLGLILQGACLLAIGTFISTTTRNQIVAGGVTFFVCLLLWLLSWFTAFDSGPASQVVNYISIVTHFENFSKGVLDSKDVVFYLSMIFFSLFITSRAMESLRWRS